MKPQTTIFYALRRSDSLRGADTTTQSISAVPENHQRICRALGYNQSTAQAFGVNSLVEAVIHEDMNGFDMVGTGDDWLWIECFNRWAKPSHQRT